MRKDALYLFTVLSITLVFLVISLFSANYFIKASANQLIEVQVETSKREANEIASIINFQLSKDSDKEEVLKNLQETILGTNTNAWFISVLDWSGKKVCYPDKTKLGEIESSNAALLESLKEKNNSEDLYDLLVANKSSKGENVEVIHTAPVKSTDLLVAANVNISSIDKQLQQLKRNFYMIFLIMGILVIILSSLAVRIIGSNYEKHLELKYTSLESEVINLSKLNTDLVNYKERKEKELIELRKKAVEELQKNEEPIEALPKEEEIEIITETNEFNRKRILTYMRNELVPVLISDIAYIYTENTITYVMSFDGKKSTSNASLDDMYSNFDPTLFFRANRQYIISISAIDKIIKYGKSQLKIVLNSKVNEEIIISKNKAAEFKQWLNM
ncbi:LytTr DNA-binding domain-containing protein [Tenacibaculum skagerrakense]|uniref:LytTr DNA-binding domain-containing protein n=1 Tax=Tenacibaculum skagerrakense TaxID=186571 RepID=A0A4R2NQ61_9FLAO|nr:LytTR family DNA-binding domain-containing protein [Tenacibaculum skagerrakense]TCP23973.1 LytTr DNA-binding domain-containing protein [Tenacibaculum skagerrakense]